jgi:predicted PurR-regulated permease PerM
VQQGDRLVTNAPSIVKDVRDSRLLHRLDKRFDVIDKASNEAAKLPKVVGNQIGSVVAAVIAGAFGLITIMFLTLFLLAGGGSAARGIVQVFPRLVERRWWVIIQGAYTGISAYVGGAIIIALLGGISVALMAFFLDLPYALPLGLWMMLLEIIPMVGASIGAIPAIIVAFVAGGVADGIIMVVFILVYQQVENIVIQPRVQGRAASLSPLVIFLSVLIGSQLLGVLGALFAVPVAGVIHIFIRQVVELRGSDEVELPALLSGETVTQEEIAADGPTELIEEDVDGSSEPGDGSGSGRSLATE